MIIGIGELVDEHPETNEDWKTTKGEACIKFAHRSPGEQNAQDLAIAGVGELVVEPPETSDSGSVGPLTEGGLAMALLIAACRIRLSDARQQLVTGLRDSV